MAPKSRPGNEPMNFSWVEKGILAGCGFPGEIENVQFLVNNNVVSLVSLTAEKQVDLKELKDDITVYPLPIKDYTPPTMEQVEQFIQVVKDTRAKGRATCIHCAHGMGRTGTMLSCYFVNTSDMTAEQAIAHVRKLRPGSVETPEQEQLVAKYYDYWQDKKKKIKAAAAPLNFSWAEPGVLCGCGFPGDIANLQYLVNNNVVSLVSLTAEKQVDTKYLTELKVYPLPIEDYTPPTMEQVEQFIKIVLETKARNKATCIHCAHGMGRTGTMLSCYFVKTAGMTAEQAIAHVRKLRPGSVETADQEQLVAKFYNYNKSKGK